MMLGKLLSEDQGQVTVMRVLPTQDGRPVVEVSFQASGQFLDAPSTNMGTYTSAMRADGTLFGEGQGVVMTADGDSVAWRGQGVGEFTGPGAVKYRGALYFETTSAKFTEVNSVAGVYEYECDESGKTTTKLYEWK